MILGVPLMVYMGIGYLKVQGNQGIFPTFQRSQVTSIARNAPIFRNVKALDRVFSVGLEEVLRLLELPCTTIFSAFLVEADNWQ